MKLTLTKSDMMKGQAIAPGWYKAEIVAFNVKAPKGGGDSLNYVPTFRIPSMDGFEMNHYFNSQAIGNMGPLVAALQNKTVKQVMDEMKDGTLEFDTDKAIGGKLQIKVVNETYENRLVNKIDGFLPYDAQAPF